MSDTEHRRSGRGPSYEEARDELVEVVRTLEAGGVTLEESLALWERGEHLAASARPGSTAHAPGSLPVHPPAR